MPIVRTVLLLAGAWAPLAAQAPGRTIPDGTVREDTLSFDGRATAVGP